MRNHKPYTDWIVSEEVLSAKDAQALQTHLRDCAACSQLLNQWTLAKGMLAAPVMAEPRPGFVGRWKAQTASRQQKPNFLRTWYVLTAAGISGLLLIAGGLLVSGQSASQLLLAGRAAAASAFANLEEGLQNLIPFALFVGQPIPPIFWIVGVVLLILVSVAWFLLLRFFSTKNDSE
jgi:hypothetical protein